MPVSVSNPEGLAPPPAGVYSHVAVATGSRQVYVAGQIGTDATGELVADDLAGQVAQAYRNVVTALSSAGAGVTDLVRLTFYVVDWTPEKFPAFMEGMQAAVTELGASGAPASLIGVQILFQPGVLVEIEATAVVD